MHQKYCHLLKSNPPAGMGTILVTGANGFIGRHLIPDLLARGYKVRALVRQYSDELQQMWPGVEIIVGNALHGDVLSRCLHNIDTAFYLLHSLTMGRRKFESTDIQLANQFQKVASEEKVKRIIYLGSLGDEKTELSAHLRNRIGIAKVLRQGEVPVTYLRAAVIIGSKSASYLIIKYLILKCPIFIIPSQANSFCQPIFEGDVVRYLVGSLENPHTTGKTYDIGGDQFFSYSDMLKIQAKILGKRKVFIKSDLISLSMCGKIASIFTPIPHPITKMLIDSCKNDAVCKNDKIREAIPFSTLSYEQALITANSESDRFSKQQSAKGKRTVPYKKNKEFAPPSRSKNIFSDVINFCIHKPDIPTLIKFNTRKERENYSQRIMQRLGIDVSKYGILNIHQIGINAPTKYVFEELIKWDGDSTCWPNFIANVSRTEKSLDQLTFYLFGLKKYPMGLNKLIRVKPLFHMKAIKLQTTPDEMESDNARYLLYKSSGGYPIGVFSMYVRSSIAGQDEKEESQLFLMVGFNFYGKKAWSQKRFINRIWELIHDRVTANTLNRIKQLSEWRFQKMQMS